ncbi:MAG: histidine phosphatase family protein [Candidatus Limnocylindrales bacterium]
MRLNLLRHAHAGDPETWTGPEAERPLSDKGRDQSERLGRFLAKRRFAPDTILTSPKVRARQTAEIVGGHLGVSVVVDDRLAENVDLAALDAVLRDAGYPESPVVVGHDPDFSELLGTICGSGSLPMRKGALAQVEVGPPLAAATATLRWLVPPDLLKPEG